MCVDAQLVVDVAVYAQTRSYLVVVVTYFITLVVLVAERCVVGVLVGTSRYAKVVALADRVTCQQVEPVGVHCLEALQIAGELILGNHTLVEHRHKAFVGVYLWQRLALITYSGFICFFAELDAFIRVHEVVHLICGALAYRYIGVVVYADASRCSFLCGNYNDTVRCL